MQDWNAWFRQKQGEGGRTIEEFARQAGVNVRSVNDWRKDRIPGKRNLQAIVRVLGEPGPLPRRTKKERDETIQEILTALDLRVTELEARLSMPLSELQIADLRLRLGLVQAEQQQEVLSPPEAEAQ